MINERAANWLEERNLDVETATRFGLYTTSRPGGEPSDDEAADWLAVPYKVDDVVVNVKFRRLSEKDHQQTKGGKQVLWNRDVIRDKTLSDYPLVITEGEWDALAAIEAGYVRTVSVPGGAPSQAGTASHAYIDEAWNDIREVDTIIIATDNDEAGCNLRDDLVARFGKAKCKTIRYPKGCKDLGDALRLYGIKGVQAALNTAQYIPEPGVRDLDDMPDSPPLNPLKLQSFGFGFHNHIGLCRGHLSVWTGEANGGKSSVMRQVIWSVIEEAGWRVGGAFFEDNIKRTFVPAMERIYTDGRPFDGGITRAHDWVRENIRFITPPDDEDPTVPWVLEMAEICVRRHGCNFIVIDPWTELDLQLGAGLSETEAARKYLTALKRFARVFNVHVALICHPRKSGEYGGTKKMADGYDISGSAHFKNKCDLGVTIQADPKVKNLTNVRVWKSKYKEEMGPTGDFALMFDPRSRRFSHYEVVEVEAEVVERIDRRKWQQQ